MDSIPHRYSGPNVVNEFQINEFSNILNFFVGYFFIYQKTIGLSRV